MENFGTLLAKYRRQCLDPVRGGMLTQERLAELLEEADAGVYSGIRISNWERGQEIIRQDNRKLLVGLIYVLHRYGGLATLVDADSFLFLGGYRNLDETEIHRINPLWLDKQTAPPSFSAVLNKNAALTERQSFIAALVSRTRRWYSRLRRPQTDPLYNSPSPCGRNGIDLGNQRLLVSTTFGAYFTGLLERPHNYIEIQGQIISPSRNVQTNQSPVEHLLHTLHHAQGSRTLILAAEGGMGKSTLAAKIVRCLFEEQAFDLILGDSAKNQQVNLITGSVVDMTPAYYDVTSFYAQMYSQLGLPHKLGQGSDKQLLSDIRDRLIGRRALIVVDNLETVEEGNLLLQTLSAVTSRDVRAIVTTRTIASFKTPLPDALVIHLRPLTDINSVRTFLIWHIQHYQNEHPLLGNLQADLDNHKRLQTLIERTGGVPLLMQLVLSDVARNSWRYLDELPQLFGHDLLDFLYAARWNDLRNSGYAGTVSHQLLRWLANEQYRGHNVSLERLAQWGQDLPQPEFLAPALRLLHERFLIVNHDLEQGNFALFPSLIEFLQQQE